MKLAEYNEIKKDLISKAMPEVHELIDCIYTSLKEDEIKELKSVANLALTEAAVEYLKKLNGKKVDFNKYMEKADKKVNAAISAELEKTIKKEQYEENIGNYNPGVNV